MSYIQKRGRGRPPKNSPVFAVAKNKVASSSVRARRNTNSVAKKKQDSPESPVVRRRGRPPARKRSNSSDSFATAAKIPRFSKQFDDESTDCDSDEDISSSAQGKLLQTLPISALKGNFSNYFFLNQQTQRWNTSHKKWTTVKTQGTRITIPTKSTLWTVTENLSSVSYR